MESKILGFKILSTNVDFKIAKFQISTAQRKYNINLVFQHSVSLWDVVCTKALKYVSSTSSLIPNLARLITRSGP